MEDRTRMRNPNNIVEFDNVCISFYTENGTITAAEGVSFDIPQGKIVGIVGESGSGKTVTALSMMQLLPESVEKVVKGEIRFNAGSHVYNVISASEKELQKLRGSQIAMIFQEPLTSLNPVLPIGKQIEEAIAVHNTNMKKKELRARSKEMLRLAGIAQSEEIYQRYPYELSGGMCQRVLIAMGLSCNPRLIVADEPTTALDATTQTQILGLLREWKEKRKSSIMLITHDLGVIAELADYVVVMCQGRVVEKGTVQEMFQNPVHPYTVRMLNPELVVKKKKSQYKNEMCVEVRHLKKYFLHKNGIGSAKRLIKAVDDVSFSIEKGTTMGLVGESGCGKSTMAHTLLRLLEKTDGEVLFQGRDIHKLGKREMRTLRSRMQIIFQDTYSSLPPRLSIGETIGEAVRTHKIVPEKELDVYVTKIMNSCGLQEYHKRKYPHELSGGERQRSCIARAIAVRPEFIICDEPVSSLDGNIQIQILELLKELQQEFGLTYLFISHDLSVVEYISDTIGIMYQGKLVEVGDAADIFENPLHPYTRTLLNNAKVLDIKKKQASTMPEER